ncbi:MAG: 3-oxoacyl-ACP reductase FabG [Syntrophomonadaceae bacterium]|nr:3-oxoacyl-ACP reductase FabG [Syntrophomonadaceae bacterium]
MKKTALITGGSKGIGRATAKLFAANKYNVIINYLNSEKNACFLVSSLEKQGHPVMACKADITKRDQVEAMIQAGIRKFGTIDILVNNAGIAQQKLFTDISEKEWDRMLDVNVKGLFNCCQCVVPHMVNKKAGKIINISSVWGITGASCEVHYSTAKAAVIGFTKALARELGPSNIQVNCVAPGIIATDMNAGLDESARESLLLETPLLRFGTPADIAHAIFYLASEQADFLTGQVISPNGGFVI